MSEMFTKIISTDPDSTRIWELKDKINEAFGEKYKIKFEQSDAAQFEDCGENLEEIICPRCGKTIDFDWWGEAMDRYFQNESQDLSVELPCCGETISLNDLNYNMPCGLACASMIVEGGSMDDKTLDELQNLVGEKLRVILKKI